VYLAAIRWVDDALRRLREKLEHEGLLDDTVIVFGSDHGETFGENGVHGHARNVLTPVLRVPLVIRLPFTAEPIRVSGQVRNIDVAPTIVEIAGLPAPASFEGRSLLPLLDQSRKPDDRISFARLAVPLFFDASVQDSINAGDWSYARNATPVDGGPAHVARGVAPGAEFLFDRRVDPEENVNLVGREAAEAERLRGQLAEQIERPAEEGVRSRDVRIDPAIAERLRAMGYLQDPQ
jgi:arylsulfatase A-like enzyme